LTDIATDQEALGDMVVKLTKQSAAVEKAGKECLTGSPSKRVYSLITLRHEVDEWVQLTKEVASMKRKAGTKKKKAASKKRSRSTDAGVGAGVGAGAGAGAGSSDAAGAAGPSAAKRQHC